LAVCETTTTTQPSRHSFLLSLSRRCTSTQGKACLLVAYTRISAAAAEAARLTRKRERAAFSSSFASRRSSVEKLCNLAKGQAFHGRVVDRRCLQARAVERGLGVVETGSAHKNQFPFSSRFPHIVKRFSGTFAQKPACLAFRSVGIGKKPRERLFFIPENHSSVACFKHPPIPPRGYIFGSTNQSRLRFRFRRLFGRPKNC